MEALRLRALVAIPAAVLVTLCASARPCAAQQFTAAAGNVTLKLTIPEGVTKVKGVLTFTSRGLASGWAGSAAFQDLAKRLNAGIAVVSGGDDLNDNSYPNRCKSGEFNGIPMAFEKLAMMSNHPELAHAPLVGMGHSHGGDYWNWFNACHPERMAMVMVHASGGVNYTAGALKVPVFYTLGTSDLIENGSGKPRAGMFSNRGKGAPMTMVISPGGHDTQFPAWEYKLVTDIIEATFKIRVPADADPAKGPVRLNDMVEGPGTWVGDLNTKEIAPFVGYKGNLANTSFLPNEQLAMAWKTESTAMPTSVMLPTGNCGWCGTPKDEPAALPGGPVVTPPADPDAGAPPAQADAGASPMPDPVTPTPGPVDAAVAKQDAKPAATTKKDAAPVPVDDEGVEETPPASGGGCTLARGSHVGDLGGAALLLVALGALVGRRRRG